jgi:hypothetical protein
LSLNRIQSQNRNRFPMAGYSSHNSLNYLLRRSCHPNLNLNFLHWIQRYLLIRSFLRPTPSPNRSRCLMKRNNNHSSLNFPRRSRCLNLNYSLNLSYFLNLMSSLTRNPKQSG